MEWNYKTNLIQDNGYEDIIEKLNSYNKIYYMEQTEKTKQEIVEEVFYIYRNKNIFPIIYYNKEGIFKEIQKCIEKEVSLKEDKINFSLNQGSSLCRFLFPNLSIVECKGKKNNSPYDKFYNDYNLKKAIAFCLNYKTIKNPVTPSCIRDGLDMLGGNVATNFKPMTAKAIYEEYCPFNGIIYDFSCGFGGRMLGALTSKNNYKYFGVEPCSETYTNLNILGNYIEEYTKRKNIFKIYKKGSEEYQCPKSRYVDFAFSSPPYYNLEKYSEENTQCYIKYPTINEWFEGYVIPTIKNIFYMLKENSFYAVNIADFKIGKEKIEYVNKWIEYSVKEGFEYIKNISMSLQTRRGYGHDETNQKTKQEGIYIFKKGKNNGK